MGLFNRFFRVGQKNNPSNPVGIPPVAAAGQMVPQPPVAQQPTASIQPPPPKTLAELEQEIEAQYVSLRSPRAVKRSPSLAKKLVSRLTWMAILLGIPAGALWVVNLPYPPIRRPIARVAPILLLPSYMNMDQNYREAITLVEQSDQLINQATGAADIELGEQKLQQARESLDALPIWFLYDFPEYRHWWYSWRFSRIQFDTARARVGTLEAKVFQEKNAQLALIEAEQAVNAAKQQYQAATTAMDKQAAIGVWRSALDQLNQIPGETVAGEMARQKGTAYQREFQETVGLAAGNERVRAVIEAARGFAWEAAKMGENPPHTAEEWRQVEAFWQQAIDRLASISTDDVAGYAEAQKSLISYSANLAEVRSRREEEEQSEQAFRDAQQKIRQLQESIPVNSNGVDRNRLISQLQGIIDQLKQVENGTTVYNDAQQLLLFAQNKLNQLQK